MMKNTQGIVVYIGKAKNLKKRVSSYFTKTHSDFKTMVLVSVIDHIETVATRTENEALILESQLIKEYQPKYNVLLKADKSFPYIKITKEPFPKLLVTRYRSNDQATYFGPLATIGSTRYMRRLLMDLFPIRDCKQDITLTEQQPKCMLLDIEKCIGPCIYKHVKSDYDRYIQDLTLLLSGKNKELLSRLKQDMQSLSDQNAFEKAAKVRDTIKKVEYFAERQDVHLAPDKQFLIWGSWVRKGTMYVIVQAYIQGKLLRQKGYYHDLKQVTEKDIIERCFTQYVMEFNPEGFEVICNDTFAGQLTPLIEQFDLSLSVHIPQKGLKNDLVKAADKNAKLALMRLTENEMPKKPDSDALELLQKEYRLMQKPERIMGFDISHLQGTDIVGSAVYFKYGLPYKDGYRRFSVRSVSQESNDPLSMKEVVFRRLKRCLDDQEPLPHLVVIDGGRAQINFAAQALDLLNLRGKVDIISLAKKLEEVYTMYREEPYLTDLTAPSTTLLQRVRDESHRFAVSYQRIKRSKTASRQLLSEIKGLGNTKINLLYERFRTIQGIQQASVEDLITIPGIGKRLANHIKFFLKHHDGIEHA